MIRPILTELALFVVPFVAYALFLLATRAGVLDPASWPPRILAFLTLSIMPAIAFFLLAQRYVISGLTGGAVKG